MKRLLLLSLLFGISNFINSQGWGEIQKIVSNDRKLSAQFGNAVAIDGNYAVVGAFSENAPSTQVGVIYIYEKDGTDTWNLIQSFSGVNQWDFLGHSVAIDGDYIFVGAIGQDYNASGSGDFMSASGAVYIYENNGGTWSEVQKIIASDREELNKFGNTVAIDGEYAVVGAYIQDYDAFGDNFSERAGAVYIFERDANNTWNEVQKIVASDRAEFDHFGRYAVSIDGEFLVVGAQAEDEDALGMNTISSAGSAYVFERDGTGTWNEVQKIVASDREQGEWFGKSVGLDGDILIVGAEQEYLENNTSAKYGAAYVFERDGNNVWNQVQKIKPNNLEHQSKFGHALDLDGDRVIVGAYRMDIGSIGDGGTGFMFEKDEVGIWNQTAIMYDPAANSSDYFGFSVAISGDYAMVGAYQEDEDETGINFLQEAGSVYTFNVNEPNTLPPLNTLSLIENNFDTVIKAYPNPTQKKIHIDLKTVYETIEISVINILGQTVLKQTYNSIAQIDLNLKDLEKGLYIVNLKLNHSNKHVLKIIKH